METVTPPIDLAYLETLLQQCLQQELPQITPIQANCRINQGALFVVIKHRAPVLEHPQKAFRLIEQVLDEQDFLNRYQGLFYLEVQGKTNYYAFRAPQGAPLADDVAAQVQATTPEGLAQESTNPPKDSLTVLEVSSENSLWPPPSPGTLSQVSEEWSEDEVKQIATEIPPAQREAEMTDAEIVDDIDIDFDISALNWEPVTETDATSPEPLERPTQGKQKRRKFPGPSPEQVWLGIVTIGAALSVAVFVGTLYALSRPCVVGSCSTLEKVQVLGNEAIITVQNPSSGQAILQAQQQLNQADRLLGSIPPWSSKYQEAQELKQHYQEVSKNLEQLVKGLQKASRSALLTQKPPLPLARWQEAEKSWLETIALLGAIPATSQFYNFARDKMAEYRQNLVLVRRWLQLEQTATTNLEAAKEVAKMAEARSAIAQSLDGVQLAWVTWQTALDRLKLVPKGTTVYDEAQEEVKNYLPKLAAARDRFNRERAAASSYNKGVQLALSAQAAQANNQWSIAINYWQNAINSLRQVPNDAFDYARAQPLLKVYTEGLISAQNSLTETIQVNQTRNSLDRVCRGADPICVYTVTRELISVRLTPNYVQKIRQRARQAQTGGNVETQIDVFDSVFDLEQTLIRISNTAKIPLEIYTTDNLLVKTHRP